MALNGCLIFKQIVKMKYTLWKLLNDRGIEIPVFQRDYAQGRTDKTALRRDFLKQLIGALAGHKEADGNLDFVYSFGDGTKYAQPLDGQQRLTTLWLLHWYIAVRVLKEDELKKALKTLSKFSYRTRHSSSNFIYYLCQSEKVIGLKDTNEISSAICDSTWFEKSWLQDPTVSGILTTLRGHTEHNKLEPNGIQPILAPHTQADLANFWTLLTSEVCPIQFDHLNIEKYEVKSPDLLYIKMNARGKSLSAYEKFKAQWIAEIGKTDKNLSFEISRWIDNQWSDIFWGEYGITGIDERKMAFYTRFFLYRF